jgi:hypothetical protein
MILSVELAPLVARPRLARVPRSSTKAMFPHTGEWLQIINDDDGEEHDRDGGGLSTKKAVAQHALPTKTPKNNDPDSILHYPGRSTPESQTSSSGRVGNLMKYHLLGDKARVYDWENPPVICIGQLGCIFSVFNGLDALVGNVVGRSPV